MLAGLDADLTKKFFSEAWAAFQGDQPFDRPPLLTVAHALGSHIPFFDQIELCFGKVLFSPKSRSQDLHVISHMAGKEGWVQSPFSEEDVAYDPVTSKQIEAMLELNPGEPLFVIDVGGKLAAGDATALKGLLSSRRVHVVEGTENGYIKYESVFEGLDAVQRENLRVWSVARSRLKDAEDSLTGRAIVEATETIVRVNYGLLGDFPATVFGYGKIGRSVAQALREKHLLVGVTEINPLLKIAAQADGFELRTMEQVQQLGGYVFLATGSAKKVDGLHLSFLQGMRRNTLVSFVTSVDDELKGAESFSTPGWLKPVHTFPVTELLPSVVQGSSPKTRVRENLLGCLHYLPKTPDAKVIIVNQGSPPNFLFEASCGPYIFLVFFGMLASLHKSSQGQGEPSRINELSHKEELRIAEIWLEHFGQVGLIGSSATAS